MASKFAVYVVHPASHPKHAQHPYSEYHEAVAGLSFVDALEVAREQRAIGNVADVHASQIALRMLARQRGATIDEAHPGGSAETDHSPGAGKGDAECA